MALTSVQNTTIPDVSGGDGVSRGLYRGSSGATLCAPPREVPDLDACASSRVHNQTTAMVRGRLHTVLRLCSFSLANAHLAVSE